MSETIDVFVCVCDCCYRHWRRACLAFRLDSTQLTANEVIRCSVDFIHHFAYEYFIFNSCMQQRIAGGAAMRMQLLGQLFYSRSGKLLTHSSDRFFFFFDSSYFSLFESCYCVLTLPFWKGVVWLSMPQQILLLRDGIDASRVTRLNEIIWRWLHLDSPCLSYFSPVFSCVCGSCCSISNQEIHQNTTDKTRTVTFWENIKYNKWKVAERSLSLTLSPLTFFIQIQIINSSATFSILYYFDPTIKLRHFSIIWIQKYIA